MHLDVFTADCLGWLFRVLVAFHLFKYPGIIYVEQSGFSIYGIAATCFSGRYRITTEWGWQEGGEGAAQDEAEC